MVKRLNGKKLAMELHPKRDCIYEEALACKRLKKDTPEVIDEQMEAYRELNFPRFAGLYSNGVMVREHNNPELIELNEKWWQQVVRYSKRDQLSFQFVFFNYAIEPLSEVRSFVKIDKHKKRK
jgi:hypothetical protein